MTLHTAACTSSDAHWQLHGSLVKRNVDQFYVVKCTIGSQCDVQLDQRNNGIRTL